MSTQRLYLRSICAIVRVDSSCASDPVLIPGPGGVTPVTASPDQSASPGIRGMLEAMFTVGPRPAAYSLASKKLRVATPAW